jgi:hypothetical protein
MKNRWEEVLEVTEQLGEWGRPQSYRKRYEDGIKDGVFYRKFIRNRMDYKSSCKKVSDPIDPLKKQKLWKGDKEGQYAFAVQTYYAPKVTDKSYQLVVIPGDIKIDDAMACVVLQHLDGCRRRADDGALCSATPLERLKEKLKGTLAPNTILEKNHTEFNVELCWKELTRTKEQNEYEERLLRTFYNGREDDARLLAAQNTPGIEIAFKNDECVLILRVPVFGLECRLQVGDDVRCGGVVLSVTDKPEPYKKGE